MKRETKDRLQEETKQAGAVLLKICKAIALGFVIVISAIFSAAKKKK